MDIGNDKETEVQGGYVASPMSHSYYVVEPGFKPRSPGSRAYSTFALISSTLLSLLKDTRTGPLLPLTRESADPL